jgi:hypothetical protein
LFFDGRALRLAGKVDAKNDPNQDKKGRQKMATGFLFGWAAVLAAAYFKAVKRRRLRAVILRRLGL